MMLRSPCRLVPDATDEQRAKHNAAALALVTQGESTRNETLDVAELASYTMVANLILNFDGTITKE